MKNYQKAAAVVLLLLVVWHIKIAMTSKITLTGICLARPADGYTWKGINNAESKFFWQDTDVKWRKGTPHADFKAETSGSEGIWNPAPGYVFEDKTTGLETVWKPGILHPDYMAMSGKQEDQWNAVPGYRLVYDGSSIVDAVWEPNRRYNDLKVISLTEKDRYDPFPGYEFANSGGNLNVVWVPGSVNYERPHLIAGQREGSWVANYKSAPVQRRSGSNKSNEFVKGLVVGTVVGGATGVVIGRSLR